jgi:gluconolactonase
VKKILLLFVLSFIVLRVFPQKFYFSSDLTAEHIFTGDCEGPATDRFQNLYAVNFQKNGTIAIIHPGKSPELFLTLPEGSAGNGLRFNKNGDLFVADYMGHNVLKIKTESKEVSVFATHEKLNQPNDLAISNADILFISDPNWKEGTGQLWKVMPDGRIFLLESNMGTTNGIEVSPDDRRLYVNESVQKCLWVYDLDREGNISNKRLFFRFPDFGLDGMRCDAKGNLFVTRYGKGCIAIISPWGKLLREVYVKGKKTSNVTFGGPDGKTVYVTLQDRGCIEWFRSKTKGAR